MRRTSLAGIALLAIVAAPAAAATRSFPSTGFTRLKVEGPFDVRVRTGGPVAIVAHGPQARLGRLIVEKRGDTLVVTTERGWSWKGLSWGGNDAVSVDIAVPSLQAAEITGSGTIGIDRVRASVFTALLTGSGDLNIGRLDTGRLKADLNGSGDMTVSGRTGRAEASVLGSGGFRGAGLAVDLLSASVTGSGHLTVGPTRVARATLLGSGDIDIAGRPRCTINKTGSGDIRCGAK